MSRFTWKIFRRRVGFGCVEHISGRELVARRAETPGDTTQDGTEY